MSRKFWDLKQTESFEEAEQELKEKGLEHTAEFFIETCEDRTWINDGGDKLMEPLLLWLIEADKEERIDPSLSKKIAEAIQFQYRPLDHILPRDVEFVIEGQTIPVCSFMFTAQSPFFKELVRRTVPRRGPHRIELRNVKLTFFDYIREFINTAHIEYLWREEPKYILNFIRQAQKLGLEKMAAFSAEVYKRYLTDENVLQHLQLAQREYLKDLETKCCDYINERHFGFTLEYLEGIGLEVRLEHLLDEGVPILDHLKKQISYLVCRKTVAEDSRLVRLIQEIPRLVSLDLSNTTGLSPDLLAAFPSVKHLNLSKCSWLDDDQFIAILQRTLGLIKLKLSEDTRLTYRSWGTLANLTQLIHLDVSYCDQMDDDDVDLMASSCPRLSELFMQFTRISDKGLGSVARNCLGLAVLDLSDCRNLKGEGLVELGEYAQSLQVLNLTNCRGVDAAFLEKFRKVLPSVQVTGLS